MASIWKPKTERRNPNAKYRVTWTDERGQRHTIRGCTDKRASEEIGRKLEDSAALRRRGVLDRTAERIAEQCRRPIAEHITDFMTFVRARKSGGHARRYLVQVESRVRSFIAFARVAYLPEIDADRVAAFLDHLQQQRLSGVTVNEYIGTLKDFTRWTYMTYRLAKDPLAATKKTDPKKIDHKRPRRAFSGDEIGALLTATLERPELELRTIRRGPNAGRPVAKVSGTALAKVRALGRERKLAYLLALWTGLRRSELRALHWGDVCFDSLPVRIALRAHTTKAKRADTVALHPQIVDALRAHKPKGAKPTDRVLRTVPSMKVLRADLMHAGVPHVTEAGRLDLHAMRKSLATYLAAQGVSQRLTQAHLRHTDPRLTAGVYTDESLLPVATAIADLPALPTKPVRPVESLRMTGTCDTGAAPAQRTAHPGVLSGATECANTANSIATSGESQAHEKTATCAAVHHDSQKRVMGLEPTTFTLAT
jgi:integrase/recombinase XerC